MARFASCVVVAVCLAACGGGAPSGNASAALPGIGPVDAGTPDVQSAISLMISPAFATVAAGGRQDFSAIVTNTPNTSVTWSSDLGTIDATGLWQAPATAGTAHVVATSIADLSKFATAEVLVQPPSNISVTVTLPSLTFEIGNQKTWPFFATVSGTSDERVIWSVREGPSGGSVDANGVYTVPFTEGIFHIVATSVADPTKSGFATATVGPNSKDLVDHGGPLKTHSRTFLIWWGDMSLYPPDARPAIEGFLAGFEQLLVLGHRERVHARRHRDDVVRGKLFRFEHSAS